MPVRHVAGDRAFYSLNNDEIVLPERGQFPSANQYYQTAPHELGHSTGHPERMNRKTLIQGIEGGFGSPDYAKEELRAEISAMMTGEREAVRKPAAVAATRAPAPGRIVHPVPPLPVPQRTFGPRRRRSVRSQEMFDRTVEPDPRTGAPPSRNRYRMRDGHRREYAASRDRGSTSLPERCARGLADIGVYGAVSYRDLAEARFGGHPYTTRRAVNAWIRDGLVTETTATGPKGNPFKVLTLTRSGVAEARKRAAERGMDPSQEIRFARTRPAQAAHDTAVYRACMKEKQRLLDRGATVRRIRLDTELKSAVARGSEAARLKIGRRAADAERRRRMGPEPGTGLSRSQDRPVPDRVARERAQAHKVAEAPRLETGEAAGGRVRRWLPRAGAPPQDGRRARATHPGDAF